MINILPIDLSTEISTLAMAWASAPDCFLDSTPHSASFSTAGVLLLGISSFPLILLPACTHIIRIGIESPARNELAISCPCAPAATFHADKGGDAQELDHFRNWEIQNSKQNGEASGEHLEKPLKNATDSGPYSLCIRFNWLHGKVPPMKFPQTFPLSHALPVGRHNAVSCSVQMAGLLILSFPSSEPGGHLCPSILITFPSFT